MTATDKNECLMRLVELAFSFPNIFHSPQITAISTYIRKYIKHVFVKEGERTKEAESESRINLFSLSQTFRNVFISWRPHTAFTRQEQTCLKSGANSSSANTTPATWEVTKSPVALPETRCPQLSSCFRESDA